MMIAMITTTAIAPMISWVRLLPFDERRAAATDCRPAAGFFAAGEPLAAAVFGWGVFGWPALGCTPLDVAPDFPEGVRLLFDCATE